MPAKDYSLAAFILRLFLAVCVFPHGAQKLLGWWQGTGFNNILAGFHDRMGIPPIVTILVITGEFFGSIALVFGLLTRLVAASFIIIMIGAIFLAGPMHNGFFMNFWGRLEGEGFEYNLLIIGASLAIMILGGGRYAMDNYLFNLMTRNKKISFKKAITAKKLLLLVVFLPYFRTADANGNGNEDGKIIERIPYHSTKNFL